MTRVRAAGRLLVAAAKRFLAEDCLLFGAALAYYAIFSLAPVLVVVIAVAGFVFGTVAATAGESAQRTERAHL